MTIPIYFNLGGEITFPTGEAHSTALNAFTMNMVGLILVEFVKIIFDQNGFIWTAVFQGSCLLIGMILFIMVKEDLKRTHANNLVLVTTSAKSAKQVLSAFDENENPRRPRRDEYMLSRSISAFY